MIRAAMTLAILLAPLCESVAADSVVAARTIPARTVIGENDVRAASQVVAGALSDATKAIGQEARVTIYNGRPIRPADVGPPALVERNDIVRLRFVSAALVIEADGRALGRGAAGERISVMNLSSRTTVVGEIAADGSVQVAR